MGRTANAAAIYREVAKATAPQPIKEPLWLPAGWLAVVLILSATLPAMGAQPVWRARTTNYSSHHSGSSYQGVSSHRAKTTRHTDSRVRPVGYEDDIAGPALRVAGRMNVDRVPSRGYRVAQNNDGGGFGDALQEALERPFGTDNQADNAIDRADESEGLFDDLPADPFDESISDRRGVEDITEPEVDEYFEEQAPEPRHADIEEEEEEINAPSLSQDARHLQENRDDRLSNELAESSRDCAEGLAKLKAQRLNSIDLTINVTGVEGEDYPYVCSVDDGSLAAPRCWAEVTYMWKASALCHKPLYFEDVHLERYGHSWGPYVQPLVSGAHFFGTLPVLPYKMGLKTPNECVYTLGHYRPGDCAPYLIDPVPFTWRAAWFQAGGVLGVAAFLP